MEIYEETMRHDTIYILLRRFKKNNSNIFIILRVKMRKM